MRLIYALFSIIILHLPMVASADYLDTQIAELTKQKQEKIKILEECQKNTKGLKIAGLTTLGVSAIGVGVNIGEAIMLKGQKSDIEDKEKQLDELDSKISSTKILITENNTCGPSDCQGDGNTAAVTLNGIGPVCINNNWAVKECKPGFSGRLKKCKRKGVEISYYDACATDYSYDSCGTENCDASTKTTAAKEKHGYNPVCILDNWAVQSCEAGYGGTLKKCRRKGVEIEYYDACTKDAAFNTCGSAECDGSTQASKMAELNGAGPLCVDKEWTVRTCNTGYIGEKQQCTREGTSYDYYFKCEPEANFQSCGSANCTGEEAEAMKTLHGKPAICINGKWAVQSCDDDYSGVEQQCNRNGVLVKYFHQCTKPNTCGSSSGCTGDGSTEAAELNGSLPICFGGLWHVRVCNEGYSGEISTCTRDGVTYSYYANGCSEVIVPDGVTVKDNGDGTYDITIDGNTFNVDAQGGIATIEGQPGNYTYTTHNGNVYNIGTVIINGGTGGNGTVDGNININWNFNGIDGLSNINLVQGNSGTLTINGIVDGLILEVTSSNEDVVDVTVDGDIVTITSVGIGTANIKLVVKEENTDTIKWERTISVVVSGPGVCTETPNECSKTDKPQNVNGNLICINKIWWAMECADDYTPGLSLTCNGTTYVRNCYKAESNLYVLGSQSSNSFGGAVIVDGKKGSTATEVLGADALAQGAVGPCAYTTRDVQNLYRELEISFGVACGNKKVEELMGNYSLNNNEYPDTYIRRSGGHCHVAACPDNKYLVVSGYNSGSKIFNKVYDNNIALSCRPDCPQGAKIKYTLNKKDYNACIMGDTGIKELLGKCETYCAQHSVSDSTIPEYAQDACTVNLVGIDTNNTCVCNPRATLDEDGNVVSVKGHKFFNNSYNDKLDKTVTIAK